MKRVIRDPSRYYKEVGFDALTEINPTRLKLFAAIAIEYTSIESMVDWAIQSLLALYDDTDIISRINGFDGKVGIVKNMTHQSATLKGDPATLIASVLGEAATLKTYRDAMIHANLHHPKAIMARTSIKQGKPYEVDLSIRTLKALYRRIRGVQKELLAALRVIEHHFDEISLEMHGYEDASGVTNGKIFQRHLAQLRRRHSNRKFLPKVPQLAEERPTHDKSQATPQTLRRQSGESQQQIAQQTN